MTKLQLHELHLSFMGKRSLSHCSRLADQIMCYILENLVKYGSNHGTSMPLSTVDHPSNLCHVIEQASQVPSFEETLRRF